MMNEGTLFRRVLKARYFPSASFLEASPGSNLSWTWRSVFGGGKGINGRGSMANNNFRRSVAS